MLCLISELTLPRLSSECFTVSCPSGGLDGGVNGGAGTHVWLGGGSSSQKHGFVTCVDIETEKWSTQVMRIINYGQGSIYYLVSMLLFILCISIADQ